MPKILMVLIVLFFTIQVSFARDAARDLRKMRGFTIVEASTVQSIADSKDMRKIIVLDNGMIFKLDGLLLDPLPMTDVIVFAKPWPKELLSKYGDKVPTALQYQFRLLINNEAFDAELVKTP